MDTLIKESVEMRYIHKRAFQGGLNFAALSFVNGVIFKENVLARVHIMVRRVGVWYKL
jgi:hypothetical protein